MPRPLRPLSGVRVRQFIKAHHLQAALTAADVPASPTEDIVEGCCADLNWALHGIIAENRGLERGRVVLRSLERLEQGDLEALDFLRSKNGSWPHPVTDALAQAQTLKRLLDPAWAISDEATADIADLAAIAADQYRAGLANAAQRIRRESRLAGERLGFVAISAYEQLTGRAAAFSRRPDTASLPQSPSGPLIRFLQAFYSEIGRSGIVSDTAVGEPSLQEALRPANGTLERWIRLYKADSGRTQARGRTGRLCYRPQLVLR